MRKYGWVVGLLLLVGALGYFLFGRGGGLDYVVPEIGLKEEASAEWRYDSTNGWSSVGDVPACPDPFVFDAPVDVSLASGMLYPGQIRGTDYKPHGGFRFDNLSTNEVDVYAPFDARLVKAARHLQDGEVQYSLYFIHDCGVMYKLDHLRELTPMFEEIIESIPMGGEGDSRTTQIDPSVLVREGEHVATKVGFESSRNIFFDFGLYDLRQKNGVDYTDSFRASQPSLGEYGEYGVCFFDYLTEPDRSVVWDLPAGGLEGKVSDYCKVSDTSNTLNE